MDGSGAETNKSDQNSIRYRSSALTNYLLHYFIPRYIGSSIEHDKKTSCWLTGSYGKAWNGFSYGVRRHIFLCLVPEGRITGAHYHSILTNHFRPMIETLFPTERPVFRDHNCSVYMVRYVQISWGQCDDEVKIWNTLHGILKTEPHQLRKNEHFFL